MARYSHKGHDTVRYDITQNIAIRYDTIQKCFTVCKNRMLSVTNYSYIVAAPPPFLLHPLAPLKLDTGRPPTSQAALLDSAGVS